MGRTEIFGVVIVFYIICMLMIIVSMCFCRQRRVIVRLTSWLTTRYKTAMIYYPPYSRCDLA